jgi:hypothetical protein
MLRGGAEVVGSRPHRVTIVRSIVLLLVAFCPPLASARGQENPPVAPDTAVMTSRDTYRLRVQNALFGRVEVSIDNGEHFHLIGRVTRTAAAPAPDAQARAAGTIVRSSGDGIAFSLGPGQILKLLPAAADPRTKIPLCAIVTDLKARSGIFGEFLAPPGTAAQVRVAHGAWRPVPDGFALGDDDGFAFTVTVPTVQGAADASGPPELAALARLAEARRLISGLCDQYAAQALMRAHDAKHAVVSGVVILRPKLPAGEPEPITAITYSVDGDIVSAQNILPSEYGWDTTRLPNGEHVVEIRALSKYATVITRVRTLVFVNNP